MVVIEPHVTPAGQHNKEPILELSYYLVMNANVGATPERRLERGDFFKKHLQPHYLQQ